MLKDIDFYYFSGTGNTLLIVNKMKEIFEKKGINVSLKRFEKNNPREIDTGKVIGLGFPVAYQSTYFFLWEFFKEMPKTEGTEVFMVDTLGGFSGGIVGPLKKELENKGYTAIGAEEIIMPSNLNFKEYDKEKNKEKISIGLEKAEEYAYKLIQNEAHWSRIPVVSDIVHVLSESEVIKNYIKKNFALSADNSKCVKCGLCMELCPVDNISLDDYPVFENRCQGCMRCISFCPKEAISMKKENFHKYTICKPKDLLK